MPTDVDEDYFLGQTVNGDVEYSIDYSTSQLPASDKWLYVDPEYPEVYPP